MTRPLGIITSSVVAEDDSRRLEDLDTWATQLVAGFAFQGIEAELVHNMQPEPLGFARGMNDALHELWCRGGPLPDWILCVNDDLHLDLQACGELWKHRQDTRVTCPTVDYTSCPEQAATGPRFEPPRSAPFVPAICWLIPRSLVMLAQHTLGKTRDGRRQLFDESLGRAWFEDNLTARIWSPASHPFLIAPTAWGHHEGSRTSNAIPESERWGARQKFEERRKELGL